MQGARMGMEGLLFDEDGTIMWYAGTIMWYAEITVPGCAQRFREIRGSRRSQPRKRATRCLLDGA